MGVESNHPQESIQTSGPPVFVANYTYAEPKKQIVYSIIERDWSRIEDMVKGIPQYNTEYLVLSSIALSLSGAAFFALIGLFFVRGVPSFVPVILLILTLLLFVAGLFLIKLDRTEKKAVHASVKNALDEIHRLEESFEKTTKTVYPASYSQEESK